MKKAADLEIVFENDSLLVVAKPSGLPSQTTVDPKRPSAEGFVKAMSKTNTGAASPCFLVHRLDADTSGILVFAKSKRAATALTESLRNREWTKVYWAVTKYGLRLQTELQTEFTVQNHLRPAKEKRGPRTVSLNTVVRSGGDYAETNFSVLARSPSGGALIEARPRTGRMHQIRVHLAGLGMPILGDSIYNTEPPNGARLALHAAKLDLKLDNQFYSFAVKPPLDFVKLTEALGIDITAALSDLDA